MPRVSSAPPAAIDIGHLLDEGRWTPFQRGLVALTALTIVFDGADNQLLGTAIPLMMREWTMTRTAFAPVLAIGLIGMMIGGAIAGLAGDRFGRKGALLFSVAVFGLATSAIAWVTGIGSLAALRFVAGLGLGGALPNAAALASEFVPRRARPFAVTLTIVCVPLGGTVAGLLAIRILPTLGWRTLFLVGGAIPVVVALILARLLAESPRYLARHPARSAELRTLLAQAGHEVAADATLVDATESVAAHEGLRALMTSEFRNDTIALWLAFFSCLLSVYLGFNWIPSMLTGVGFPSALGSTGITVYNLGGVAGAIAGALTFARAGSRRTMVGLGIAGAVSAFAIRWVPMSATAATTPIIVMLTINGAMTNGAQTTLYALATQVYPTAIRATGVGAALAIGRAGAILSTYVGAWALDGGGPARFFVVVGIAMMATTTALALVRRHIPASRHS